MSNNLLCETEWILTFSRLLFQRGLRSELALMKGVLKEWLTHAILTTRHWQRRILRHMLISFFPAVR